MSLDQEILPLAEETEPLPPIEPGVVLETDLARLLQQAYVALRMRTVSLHWHRPMFLLVVASVRQAMLSMPAKSE